MLTAVEGLAAWKSVRQIVREIHGVDAEAVKDWDSDGNVREQMRRLVKKARFLAQGVSGVGGRAAVAVVSAERAAWPFLNPGAR